jgi:hypothetical protein
MLLSREDSVAEKEAREYEKGAQVAAPFQYAQRA